MVRVKCRSCHHGWLIKEERRVCQDCNARGLIYMNGYLIVCTSCNKTGYITIEVKVMCRDCNGLGFRII